MSEEGIKAMQMFIYDKIHSKKYLVEVEDEESGLTRRFHLNLTGQQRDNLHELLRMISKSTKGEKDGNK